MLREEISRINLGNSLDKLCNIDFRGYGVCNILYDGAVDCSCGCGGGIVSDIKADNLVTATVSDWVTTAMIASLAYILDDMDILQDESLTREVIVAASHSGMIDITGWVIPAVDCEVNVRILGLMRDIVKSTLKYRNTGDNWYTRVDKQGYFKKEMVRRNA